PEVDIVRLVGQPGLLQHDGGLHAVGRGQRIQLQPVRMLRRPALGDRELFERHAIYLARLQPADSLRPIMPARISSAEPMRIGVAPPPSPITPRMTAPTAPMPVQIK